VERRAELPQELFGCSRPPLGAKPKIDRSAGGIHSTIQVPPVPALADIGLIDPPRAIGGFQFSSASLVQLWCIALHPAPNGGVVGRQTQFYKQFLDASIRKREPQRPTDGTNNDFGFEVAPFKQGRPRFRVPSTAGARFPHTRLGPISEGATICPELARSPPSCQGLLPGRQYTALPGSTRCRCRLVTGDLQYTASVCTEGTNERFDATFPQDRASGPIQPR
jgi:hypothetical protein